MTRLKYIPEKFQKNIIEKCIENRRYGIFSFPGSGKTAISLSIIASIKKYSLVIVPNNIEQVWIDELNKWDFCENLTYNVISSSNKHIKKANITIITNTMLKWFVGNMHNINWKFGSVFIDESGDFKNPKSLKFRILKSFYRRIDYRFILSGNPIRNGYLDLWTQICILDNGYRLEESFYTYRDKHFYPIDYKRFSWRLLEGRENYILDKIKDICLFVKKDKSKLPERNEIDIFYENNSMSKEAYKDVSKKLFIDIDGDKKEISSRQVSLFKCDQVASGFVYYKNEIDKKEYKIFHVNLIDKCIEQIRKISGPIIITYKYIVIKDLLIERLNELKLDFFLVNKDNKKEASRKWNNNEISLMVSNIESISRGFNLQFGKGKTIIITNMIYNYDTYDQLIMRLERRGSIHKSIDIIRIGSNMPIHKAIFKSIDRKNAEFNRFIDYLVKCSENF